MAIGMEINLRKPSVRSDLKTKYLEQKNKDRKSGPYDIGKR